MKWYVTITLFLVFPLCTFAEDSEEIQKILTQSWEAHFGSQTKFGELPRISHSGKGILITSQGKVESTRLFYAQWPYSFRLINEMKLDQKQAKTIVVVNDSNSWLKANSEVAKELSLEDRRTFLTDVNAYGLIYFGTWADKRFTKTKLKTTTDQANHEVIRFSASGKFQVNLHFDKKTHLLVESNYENRELSLNIKKRIVLSDFKKFGDYKLATKETIFYNGYENSIWTIDKYDFPSTFPNDFFEKP